MVNLKNTRAVNVLLLVTSILFWGGFFWYVLERPIGRQQMGIIWIGGVMVIFVLSELSEKENVSVSVETVLLLAALLISVVTTVYLYRNYETLVFVRLGYALTYEYVLATAFTLSMVYLVYRAYGLTFVGVFLFAVLYGYFGDLLPGALGHGGFSVEFMLQLAVLDLSGFFGTLVTTVAEWVSLFLLFGGLLKAYGAFDFILRISYWTRKFIRSGVSQAAVVSSTIIGSINGSQAANAALTGSFTIPMMKSSGVKSETAGGIESVASTSGQLLPPVMGASAFVMADLLNLSYVDVIIAGIAPAFIYMASIAVGVHYRTLASFRESGRMGATDEDVTRASEEHIPEKTSRRVMLLNAIKYGAPLVVLLYFLGVARWTVAMAALITCLVMIGLSLPMTVWEKRPPSASVLFDEVKTWVVETAIGFQEGAKLLAPIAIIVAIINVIVDLLTATGVPGLMSLILIDLGGGIKIVTILLAMAICIILGLGMPTLAAYIFVALLIAPALISGFAIPNLAVHYFVFYAAVLSGITPPIAIAVVVAAGIAESNFWGTCKEAIRIAAPLYVLPIAFMYHPEIVVGPIVNISVVFAIAGAVSIVHGLNYPFARITETTTLTWAYRVLFTVCGVLIMVSPNDIVRIVAAVVVLGALASQYGYYDRVRTGENV